MHLKANVYDVIQTDTQILDLYAIRYPSSLSQPNGCEV